MRKKKDEEIFDYDNIKAWYIIHTKIGYEEYVKRSLEAMMETRGLSDFVFEMFIPYKDEEKKKSYFPGYIFINALMTSETWYIIRNTKYVFGFIGSSGKHARPIPVPQDEIDSLKAKCGLHEIISDLKEGESVKILTGPFEGTVCKVVQPLNDKVVVSFTLFNQENEVTVDLKDLVREEV